MRTATALLVPLALALVSAGARADIVPPGQRAVVHELVLEPDETVLQSRWIAAPWPGLVGVIEVLPGEPFRFSSKYGTRLYALGPDQALPERADAEQLAGLVRCELPLGEISSVAAASPLGRVRTHLRARRSPGGAWTLEVVGEERWDALGRPLDIQGMTVWLLVTAACGGAALFGLALRAGRAAQPAVA